MSTFTLNLDYKALGDLALRGPGTRAAVRQIAEATAALASSGTSDPIEVIDGGRSRARSYVIRRGSGAAGESRDRLLGRSLPSGGS